MKHLLRISVFVFAGLAVTSAGQPTAIEGHWEGVIEGEGMKTPVSLRIMRADDGVFLGRLSYTQPLMPMSPVRVDKVAITGSGVRVTLDRIGAAIEGVMADDGTAITGTWTDATGKAPVTLRRVTPAQPARMPPLDVPLDIKVPVRPVPFAGGAQNHFAYELHITNLGFTEARIEKLEVLADGKPTLTYEGAILNDVLSWWNNDVADNRRVKPWEFRVAWIWISLPRNTPLPREMRHRVTVDGRTTTTEPLLLSDTPAPVIGPPLKGGVWIALHGPGADSGHRLSMMTIEGRLRIPQRFGVDWIRAAGPAATPESIARATYGADVIAVADGTIAHVKDGVPDNAPGSKTPAVPITTDTVGGNVVVLDIGNGHHVFYAHLQPGVPVKAGEKVKRGQLLGKIGNSGDSLGAHLHFHVMNAAHFGEGVPFLIDSFEALAGANAGMRTNASPMNRARVRFPE